jgi:hypothetical protein
MPESYKSTSPWSIQFGLDTNASLDNCLVTVTKNDVDIGRVRTSWTDLPFPRVFTLARDKKLVEVVDILAEFGRLARNRKSI